jgi:ubiquinone/menaquinone biosynthesis C-methylase UbiE
LTALAVAVKKRPTCCSANCASAIPKWSRISALAVDIQPEMLRAIEKRKKALGVDNVEVVKGTEKSPELAPESITLALLVDAYHEFVYPREMMTALVKALRPGGRVALVEFKAEDKTVAIKAVHKMSIAQCQREMAAVGLKFREARPGLPQQHLLIFEKMRELTAP